MPRRSRTGNPVRREVARTPGVRLIVADELGGERPVAITKAATMVGRAPANDLVVDDITVSARHARLDVGAGAVTVTDLASTNGTFVDGARVDATTRLHHGAELMFGSFACRVEMSERVTGQPANPPRPTAATPLIDPRRPRGEGGRRVLVIADQADDEVAAEIASHLAANGHVVRFDDEGHGWSGQLLEAVWASDVAVFVASAASVGSATCRHQLHVAAAERTPVVVAVVADVDLPTDLRYYEEAGPTVDARHLGPATLTSLALQVGAMRPKRFARPRRTIARLAAAGAAIALVIALAWVLV